MRRCKKVFLFKVINLAMVLANLYANTHTHTFFDRLGFIRGNVRSSDERIDSRIFKDVGLVCSGLKMKIDGAFIKQSVISTHFIQSNRFFVA